MKIAYFDCGFSGVSGDMTLGALLDSGGVDIGAFSAALAALGVGGYDLVIEKVKREGITATDVDVRLHETDQGHARHLSDIAEILDASALSQRVRDQALAVFTRLADAEAKIHGTTRDQIHFHEVGAIDAIVDIVGACLLLEMLGVEKIYMSPFPVGTGTVVCQHGVMPVPAPATLELLRGFPVQPTDLVGEMVTPTGAALMTGWAGPEGVGRMPEMVIEAVGYGSGKKQFAPDRPNLLRVVLGHTAEASASADRTPTTVSVLETNIDDLSPEGYDLLMERCFAAGALDVFLTPIQMKKSRPGVLLSVLCAPADTDRITGVIFRESGTFGIRRRDQARVTLDRTWREVATSYGAIRIKIGRRNSEVLTASPEYEDCRRAALEHNVPLMHVYRAAQASYSETAAS